MAEPKTAKRAPSKSEGKPRRKKKAAAEPRSRGVAPDAISSGTRPAAVTRLAESIEADGGTVLAPYKDPLGGNWQIFAALPIDLVEPTPFQRDLSQPHVERLSAAMDKLGRYLDPMIVVRSAQPGEEGREGQTALHPYWTPNGNHRLAALRALGARSVVAIVVPDIEVAHRILLLNTEKAHNLRERSLEVIRLAELLAETENRPERDYEIEFEEPALLTLGLCYQENGRFAGGAYHSILRRVEKWQASALPKALETRRERAATNSGAGRRGERGHEGAQGARVRESLSPAVRGGPDQSDPVQARAGGCGRDHRDDAGRGQAVRPGEGQGRSGREGGRRSRGVVGTRERGKTFTYPPTCLPAYTCFSP